MTLRVLSDIYSAMNNGLFCVHGRGLHDPCRCVVEVATDICCS